MNDKSNKSGMGAGAIIGGIGSLGGAIFGNMGRRQQHRKTKELMQIQQDYNKQNMEKAQEQQFEMWQKTNFPAQVEMMKNAGLNVGLMYEGGGTGGTTGAGNMAGAGLGSAPNYDIAGDMAKGGAMAREIAQLGLLKAQKENIDADTDNKKASTEETQTNIENIIANTNNTNVKTAGETLNNILKSIENEIATATKGDKIQLSTYEVEKASYETAIILNEKGISDETKQDRINAIAYQNAQVLASTIKLQAETENVEEKTKAIETELKAIMLNAWANTSNAQTNRTALETDWKRGLGNIANQLTGMGDVSVGLGDVVKGTIKSITPRWTWKYIDKYMDWYEKGGK